MLNNLLHIVKIYWNNQGFRLLTLTVIITGGVCKIAYHSKLFSYAEDFFTLLFIFSLWLSFQFGILLKYQFANFRASVTPSYRLAHILAMLILYSSFIFMGIIWAHGMNLNFPWMSKISMAGVWGTGLLVTLFLIVLGYLSIGRCLLYGYCFLVMASMYFVQIMDLYKVNAALVQLPLILWCAGLIFFIWRLNCLREESFEYHNLLTWPPKAALGCRNQPIKQSKSIKFSKYPKDKNIFVRSIHWDIAQGKEMQFIWSMVWLAVGIYVLAVFDVPWIVKWLKNIYGNFLLFVATPLVIVSIRHYRSLIFWGYDSLRPIKRTRYAIDMIGGVLIHVLEYWILMVIILGLIPLKLFYATTPAAQTAGYFCLSGSILFLIISVLIYITAIEDNFTVIINGGLLAGVVLLYFEPASFLTLIGYILACLVCLAGGLIYIIRGYRAWCCKEYL